MSSSEENTSKQTPETPAPDPAQVYAAASLLMAAITFRDLLCSMTPVVQVAMPSDISSRVSHYRYQSAFDGLPRDVQDAARAIVEADPDIIEARRIDAEFQS